MGHSGTFAYTPAQVQYGTISHHKNLISVRLWLCEQKIMHTGINAVLAGSLSTDLTKDRSSFYDYHLFFCRRSSLSLYLRRFLWKEDRTRHQYHTKDVGKNMQNQHRVQSILAKYANLQVLVWMGDCHCDPSPWRSMLALWLLVGLISSTKTFHIRLSTNFDCQENESLNKLCNEVCLLFFPISITVHQIPFQERHLC